MLPAGGLQHRGCIIPQVVTHSLVLLKMGKIIARNMLSGLELLMKPLLLLLFGCLYYLYEWCTVKEISYNEIYLLIKYIKSVLWRVAKRLSYIQDARCLKVNQGVEIDDQKCRRLTVNVIVVVTATVALTGNLVRNAGRWQKNLEKRLNKQTYFVSYNTFMIYSGLAKREI